MTGCRIFINGVRATLRLHRPRFLKILESCFEVLHLLLFNPGDMQRFTRVIMHERVKCLVRRHPDILFQFLSGSYLALSLGTRSRLRILTNHYRFMERFMNNYFMKNITEGEIVLWDETKEGNRYSIALSYPLYDVEGNLMLILNVNSTPIYWMTFTIIPGRIFNLADDQVLYITGVQGGGRRFELIRCAAKALSDISPPTMLLIAARAIAIALNINSIAGITVKDHVQLGTLPVEEHFFANYDKFWSSMGGVNIDDRVFLLKSVPEGKPLNVINRTHRRRTRIKRQIQLDLMGQMCETFGKLCLRKDGVFFHEVIAATAASRWI